jgi:hypothetical protein
MDLHAHKTADLRFQDSSCLSHSHVSDPGRPPRTSFNLNNGFLNTYVDDMLGFMNVSSSTCLLCCVKTRHSKLEVAIAYVSEFHFNAGTPAEESIGRIH